MDDYLHPALKHSCPQKNEFLIPSLENLKNISHKKTRCEEAGDELVAGWALEFWRRVPVWTITTLAGNSGWAHLCRGLLNGFSRGFKDVVQRRARGDERLTLSRNLPMPVPCNDLVVHNYIYGTSDSCHWVFEPFCSIRKGLSGCLTICSIYRIWACNLSIRNIERRFSLKYSDSRIVSGLELALDSVLPPTPFSFQGFLFNIKNTVSNLCLLCRAFAWNACIIFLAI